MNLKKYAILSAATLIAASGLMAGDLLPTSQRYVGKSTKADAGKVWKAQKETVSEWEKDKWGPAIVYTFKYDERGNLLEDYFNSSKFIYTYNEHNMPIERVPKDNRDEKRSTFSYDPIVTDYIIEKMEFGYNAWDKGYTEKTYHHRVDITRDADNKVTGWSRKVLRPGTQNTMDELTKVTITYGEDGNARTWQLGQADDKDITMVEDAVRYDNIQWQNTDHQIVRETDYFVVGNNRVKYADVYIQGEQYATFEATYPGGIDFRSTFKANDGLVEIHYYETLDEYGSYKEGFDNTGYDEEGKKFHTLSHRIMRYDEHGNVIENLTYVDDQMQPSSRYKHTYNELGQLTETIEEVYEGSTWGNFMRIQYSDFIAVTPPSGIDAPQAAPALTAFVSGDRLVIGGCDNPTGYTLYGMNGTALQSGSLTAGEAIDLASLGHGLYIAAISTADGTTEHVKFVK